MEHVTALSKTTHCIEKPLLLVTENSDKTRDPVDDTHLCLNPLVRDFVLADTATSKIKTSRGRDPEVTPISSRKRGRLSNSESLVKLRSQLSNSIVDYLSHRSNSNFGQSNSSPPNQMLKSETALTTAQGSSSDSLVPLENTNQNTMPAEMAPTAAVVLSEVNSLADILAVLNVWRNEDIKAREKMRTELLAEISASRLEHNNLVTETTKQLRDENKVLRAELASLTERVGELEQTRTNTSEVSSPWNDNLAVLEQRVVKSSIQAMDKHLRKNNIIVRGFSSGAGSVADNLNNFIKQHFSIEDAVCEAYLITSQRPFIRAKLRDANVKQMIMKMKKALKVLVFFNEDLTPHESFIASKLWAEAKKLKEEGKSVKIGYQRLYINKVGYQFDLVSNTLVPITTGKRTLVHIPMDTNQTITSQTAIDDTSKF